jgi:hypothetical protein
VTPVWTGQFHSVSADVDEGAPRQARVVTRAAFGYAGCDER